MASLTKDELKNALVNHGVESNFAALKKDELVALYDEFVAPHDLGEFSSDDDEGAVQIISESKPAKRVSNRSKGSSKSANNGENPGLLTEENSLIEVDELTDTQLASNLKEFGVDVGPIVDSTRTLYKKKLAILLRENEASKDKVDGEKEAQNGNHEVEEPVIVTPEPPKKRVSTRSRTSSKSTNGAQVAAEFSADDDEEQPDIVVKKSTRASVTPKKTTSASSPSQSIGVSLRQRFTGTPDDPERTDRFTPTPRRSIHSYKVTETTTETMTKDKSGLVTRDVVTTKETTESKGVIGGARHILFKVLPWIFLLLIAAALVYYLGLQRRK